MARSDGQVKRTKPELWESCKEKAEKKYGDLSSRAMEYASKLYKEKGGGYSELKKQNSSISLHQKNTGRRTLSK